MNDPRSVSVHPGASAHPAARKETLVEEGTHFKGSLSSSCPIVVRGKIEGDVNAPALTVSASGAVHGKVKVGEMRSSGELAGEFDADSVQLSGSVKDKTVIRARSLEVKLQPANGKMQVVFGECTLDVGDMQADAAHAAPRAQREPEAPSPPAMSSTAPLPTAANMAARGSVPPLPKGSVPPVPRGGDDTLPKSARARSVPPEDGANGAS